MIRLNIPPCRPKSAEDGRPHQGTGRGAKVAIRNIRRDGNKHADQAEKDKELTEDDRDDVKEEIQELTKKYEGQANDLAKAKESEVMDN